jgi:DNA helicase-2/ATP-dependent DNA helicase PcrA
MIDYESDLNPEQRAVVMSDGGYILVIAGAGSGKTRTLTYRVARLIETGVRPENILLATFTNKAARSMLSRVAKLIDSNVEALWGGTFHHIGNRILRKHATLLGYQNNYTIMDDADSKHLLKSCLSDLGVSKNEKFPKVNLLSDIISLSLNTEKDIQEIVHGRFPFFFNYITDIIKISISYRIRKRELNVMDFDDLLINWRELLVNCPEIIESYSKKFLHILVDEYQDTNMIQAEILDLMASNHKNLVAVGDDSQSIYSFRGANFINILNFPEKYPHAKIYKLETNYRSTPEILNLANKSILNNEKQFQKKLKAVRRRGARPVFVPLRDVYQQADFVAQHIIELAEEGIPLGEIAVLYRAHYHSMELQMEFVKRGIPFEIRSGLRFFEQAHIKDVTSFLRLLVNPKDEVAWKRVLRLYRGIGDVTAHRLWKFLSSKENSMGAIFSDDFLVCATSKSVPGLHELRETLTTISGLRKRSPETIINKIIEGSYRRVLKERYEESTSRVEDLKQLGSFSSQYDTLENFLSDMALMTTITEENETDYLRDNNHRVVLSSIHQAKGLEWAVVFMIWCSEGMIPLARALKEEGGEDEERRLFYVATTRAKDQMYFCHTLIAHSKGTRGRVLAPSRFIRELAPSYIDPEELPFDQWAVNER